MKISNIKFNNTSINTKNNDQLHRENDQSQNTLNRTTIPIANLSTMHFSGALVDLQKSKFKNFIQDLALKYTTEDIYITRGQISDNGWKIVHKPNGEIFKYISTIEDDHEKIQTIHSAFNHINKILKHPEKIYYDTTNKSEKIVNNISEADDMIALIKSDFAESASLITHPELRASTVFELSKSKDTHIKRGAIFAIKSIDDQNIKDEIILEMSNNPENFEPCSRLSYANINTTLIDASNKIKAKVFLKAKEQYPEESYFPDDDMIKSLAIDPVEINNFTSKFIELSKNGNSELPNIIAIIKSIEDPTTQGDLLLKLAEKRSKIEPSDPFNIRVASAVEILHNCEDTHKADIIPLLQGEKSWFKYIDREIIKKALPKDLELRKLLTEKVMQIDPEVGNILKNLEN